MYKYSKCSKCYRERPASMFRLSIKNSGLNPSCKSCDTIDVIGVCAVVVFAIWVVGTWGLGL